MTDEPVVIVDESGHEHEFPAGMDPQHAAAIVRNARMQSQVGAPGPQWPSQARATEAARPAAEAMEPWVRGSALGASALMGGGAAVGAMGGPAAAASGALRTLSHPAVTATTGAYEGYRHGGIPGALEGAAGGALFGRGMLGKLGRYTGVLRTATPAAEAIAPTAMAATRAATPVINRSFVLSPAQAAEEALKDKLMKAAASREGMLSAAGWR